jgi:hypothetical protein
MVAGTCDIKHPHLSILRGNDRVSSGNYFAGKEFLCTGICPENKEKLMRSLLVGSAVLGIIGFSLPTLPAAHAEETVVIKRGHDRDWPRWHRRDRDERRVYIERRDDRWHHRRDHDHD